LIYHTGEKKSRHELTAFFFAEDRIVSIRQKPSLIQSEALYFEAFFIFFSARFSFKDFFGAFLTLGWAFAFSFDMAPDF
jgi:hypothetical protein